MLVTPAPRAQPPAKPSNQLEQEQNHIEGSISNRGRRSANTVATPLGKYRKQVIDAIGSRWQYYVKTHSDVIALGSAQVSFLVDSSGHVRAVRVESNTSNQSFADICERAIREAEIPEPPAEAIAPMRDGHLEYSINFTLYSL
jgi:outer membrane biosynthesis protein TonB